MGARTHDRSARAFLASSAGALVGKAGHLSEEVHHAMVARGYRGDARTLQTLSAGPADAAFGAAVVVVAVLAVWGDVALGR